MPEGVSHPRRYPGDADQRGPALDAAGVTAVILAGGQGTRLRPLTYHRPKPVVPLLNVPFLAYQLALLRQHGIRDVVLSCSYMVDEVRATMGDGGQHGVRLRYAVEIEPLGTAGGVRNAVDLAGGRIVVLNGDILTDADLDAMLRVHATRNAAATISLTRVPDPAAFGLVELAADGRVLRFVEKPDPSQITTDTINAGTYILERDLLGRIPEGRMVSIEREFFPGLLADGIPFFGWIGGGYWLDIGNPSKYRQGQVDLLAGRVVTPVRAAGARGAGAFAAAAITAAPGATVVDPSLIGPGSRLGEGSRVGPQTVLGAGCVVGARALVEGAILWEDVAVGEGAVLRDCIVATGARIGAGARIGPGAVLAAGDVIGDRACVPAGA